MIFAREWMVNVGRKVRRGIFWIGAVSVIFGCVGCKMPMREASPSLFIPPTLVATAFRTPTPDLFQPTPDPRGNCIDSLSYIEDVTIPDGTVVQPGEEIVKQWKIINSGTCDWNSRYSFRLIDGDAMGAKERLKLVQLEPNEEGILEITFTAPEYVGPYYTGWQAYNAHGKAFGDDLYMEIYVNQVVNY